MSRQDEPLTPAAIWWAATRTLDAHLNGRQCPQCKGAECAQLAWAVRQRPAGRAASVVPVLLAGVTP
ncbi:hypothetical protein AB0J90_30065 [Micromonospora sp. NPDC049523]|uniref:hypothetical protein n=1 Tax=Micromonospora sp. NPDC049523 TaxID=3155921 RepID=UPI003428EFF9